MLSNVILTAAGLVGLSSAHILMNEPKPFSVPALRNGPLSPDGSDFPCQSPDGVYNAGGVTNVMPLGSTQPLAFVGTAVHGGGSCQISITYDASPTKNSVWKVIHSIEGGCPARNTPGNIGNDPNAPVPFDYSFPLPDDIPAGNGTIAWTWLNKIGNREFYMNCAPVTLTGAGGSKSNYDALPDMLVANIGNGCTTEEGKDYKYPNPGKSVQKFATGDLVFPQGSCGSAARPPAGGDNNDDNTPQPAPPAPTVAPPAPSPTKKIPGGVFITVTTSDAPTSTGAAPVDDSPTPPATQPTAPSAPAPPVQPPSAPAPSAGPAGGAFAAGTPCSPEGQWNCISGTSFQRCASGAWSAPMALAAGTSCKAGTVANIEIAAASLKGRRVPIRFRG